MKFKAFVVSVVFCFSLYSFSEDVQRDEFMWKSAYWGQFSIVHKLALSRGPATINEEILNQFVMAYVYYRMGEYDEVESVFRGVDNYIECVLLSQE